MGLHICYDLSLPGSTTDDSALALLERLRAYALTLDVEVVTELLEISGRELSPKAVRPEGLTLQRLLYVMWTGRSSRIRTLSGWNPSLSSGRRETGRMCFDADGARGFAWHFARTGAHSSRCSSARKVLLLAIVMFKTHEGYTRIYILRPGLARGW